MIKSQRRLLLLHHEQTDKICLLFKTINLNKTGTKQFILFYITTIFDNEKHHLNIILKYLLLLHDNDTTDEQSKDIFGDLLVSTKTMSCSDIILLTQNIVFMYNLSRQRLLYF